MTAASLQGCDQLAQMQRDPLQSRRARIHQQINKELRMRTGAENLYRCVLAAWGTSCHPCPTGERCRVPRGPCKPGPPCVKEAGQ